MINLLPTADATSPFTTVSRPNPREITFASRYHTPLDEISNCSLSLDPRHSFRCKPSPPPPGNG